MATSIRVELPFHLRNLAKCDREIQVELPEETTIGALLDAIEARYPVLCGAIRDHATLKRRPFVRYYACEQDLSHEPGDTPLPQPIVEGHEPFLVIGSMAGG